MTKRQKVDFFERLEGPEGCNFRMDPRRGLTWKCAGGYSKDISRRILRDMGVGAEESRVFLDECDRMGGHCDCEILFNAKDLVVREAKGAGA